MENEWLKEALFGGMTANAIKLGTALSLGWFWLRTAGCSVLYRGDSIGTMDFDNILTVAGPGAKQIQAPAYLTYANNTTHFYVIRRANGCGDLEHTLAAAVKLSIDANGDLEQPKPNGIFEVRAEQITGGRVKLLWYYCPIEQKSEPDCFAIYCDNGTGQLDYENPVATIGYLGRKFYSFQSDSLQAGRYLFAIRVRGADGNEDGSSAKVAIQITLDSPDPIDVLSVAAI
jgi:hypothetical protein